MKKSELRAILDRYQAEKGKAKGCLTADSDGMTELSLLYGQLNELKDDGQIPAEMLGKIQKIIDAHLTNEVTNHLYVHLTTDLFHKLRRQTAQSTGEALLLMLEEYKSNRNTRYKWRELFYTDDVFDERLKKFKADIQVLVDEKFDEKRISPFLGYQFLHNRLEDDKPEYKIDSKHYCRRSFDDFPFHIPADDKSIPRKKLYLLWRLAIEISYATEKKHPHYREMLVQMAKTAFSDDQSSLKNYYDDVMNTAKAMQVEFKKTEFKFKDPGKWNQCYVWQGYTKYQLFFIKNPSDAESKYNTGEIVDYKEERYSDREGSYSVTVKHIIRPGIEKEPKYFYPFRQKYAEFENLINLFEDFIKNTLQLGFRKNENTIVSEAKTLNKP